MRYLLFLTLVSFKSLAAVPLKDNVLFAFEKCKALSVDLEKGQLREAVSSSFDLHCMKSADAPLALKCYYFDAGSNKKLKEETFTGGSDLGVAELRESSGKVIKFLIGKNFASYESGPEQKVCAGIYLFEKDALKKKN